MNNTILVTGGAGYIGSHTVVELYDAGYNVVIVDNLCNSRVDMIDGIEKICHIRPDFECVDCCDAKAMRGVFQRHPDICAVIHFAAFKAVGESCSNPLKYYGNNIMSLVTVLQMMKEFGVNNIVFSSSCTVYGQPTKIPVGEDAPVVPANCPYGNTKQIGEEIIRDTVTTMDNMRSILLRYFNPIGAHPSGDIGELPLGVPQNLLPYLMDVAAGKRDCLSVYGGDYNTPDGTCIRDYIDVCDLAKAHVVAVKRLLNKKTEKVEVFNLGTGCCVSVLELIARFEQSTGVNVNYKITERRPGDVEKVFADCNKANKVLGWKTETPLDETLRNAWQWHSMVCQLGV
ncbi:MAG: UDP-glucose 4-epimerase GalE [Paludibacteraceae bacterium]|nr:UDP-glucose 4-epimerase GalE [Paludibacteraceae bacterium]